MRDAHLVALGLLGLLALGGRRAAGRIGTVDPWVARMLAVELGPRASLEELRGILDVVETRAAATGASPAAVALSIPPAPQWGGLCDPDDVDPAAPWAACDYNDAVARREPHPLAEAAAQLAPVAPGAWGFVHPNNAGFNTPSARRPIYVPQFTAYLPRWAVLAPVGTARHILDVGPTPTRFTWR